MIGSSYLTESAYIITTDLVVQLIVAIVFPLICIGLAVRFFKNPNR